MGAGEGAAQMRSGIGAAGEEDSLRSARRMSLFGAMVAVVGVGAGGRRVMEMVDDRVSVGDLASQWRVR